MVQFPIATAHVPAHPADTCEIISGPRRVLRDTVKAVDMTRGGKVSVWLMTIVGAAIWTAFTPTGEHNSVTLATFAVAGSLGGALTGFILIAIFMCITSWKMKLHWAFYLDKTGLTQGWVPHTRLVLMSNCQHRVRDLTCTVMSAQGAVYSAKPSLRTNATTNSGLVTRGQRISVGYPIDFAGADRSETDIPESNEYQVVWTSLKRNGKGPVVIYKTKWVVAR